MQRIQEPHPTLKQDPDVFFLDLEKNLLLGCEDNKNPFLVNAIMEGIRAGDDFRAMPVYHSAEQQAWYLAYPEDGGHHRALAHYLAGKPLKCVLSANPPHWFGSASPIPIKDISFSDDPADEFVYRCSKLMYPNYR